MQQARRKQKKFASWRLDFNAEGFFAQKLTPHGAPALILVNGVRHFPIVYGFELHGDVGARMRKSPRHDLCFDSHLFTILSSFVLTTITWCGNLIEA